MKVHAIIDFMHIYYKYYFQLKAGKLKRLSAPLNWNGTVIEKDTTLIYYPLRDIENIRKGLEANSHEVTVSVCFDTPSVRKEVEGGDEYKSNRTKTLNDDDFKNIECIRDALEKAGYNTYRFEGYEADDIVNQLCKEFRNNFDYTVIYTNDKDLLVNVTNNVCVMRFKQYTGYTQVGISNYEQYLEQEFDVFIPYNMIGLYLATVGDSADKIKGIVKFGKKAFSKLITKVMTTCEVDMKKCGDYYELSKVVEECSKYLTDVQYEQLKTSFALVANMEILDDIKQPIKEDTDEKRREAYETFKFNSLMQ